LVSEIVRVVNAEGPIHEDLALERLKSINGVLRAGNKVRANFERALQSAVRRRMVRRDKQHFLWSPNARLTSFRIPAGGGTGRDLSEIPAEEIRLAILYLTESNVGLPASTVARETAKLLGAVRPRPDRLKQIDVLIDTLIERGELRRSGYQIVLGNPASSLEADQPEPRSEHTPRAASP
jgi:hypothetical protein